MNFTFKNKLLFTISATLRSVALLCVTGPLMQTFIEVLDLGSSFNYFYTSIFQIVNIMVILICSRFADTDNILKRCAIVNIPVGILFLLYIPLCFTKTVDFFNILLLVAAGILQSVFCALYTVCDYKLPYHIFLPEEYGVVLATTGVLASATSLAFTALISYFSAKYNYKTVMCFSFLLSFILTIVSAILFLFIKMLTCLPKSEKAEKSEKIPLLKIFRYPIFYKLLIPNLLRGIAFGTTTVLTIVAFTLGYDEKTATIMVTIQSAAFFVGATLFGFLSQRVKMHHLLFFSSLPFVLMPLLLIPDTPLFLPVYAVLMCSRTITDNAVPSVLLKSVPVEIAGPYNAWRMIIHTVGIVIATSVANIVSPLFLILATTVFHLLFALLYVTNKDICKA